MGLIAVNGRATMLIAKALTRALFALFQLAAIRLELVF